MKYRIVFNAFVDIDAETESEAIRKAWLQKNLDNATYSFVKCIKEGDRKE